MKQPIEEQLRQACKLAGARWATWIQRAGDGWSYHYQVSLPRRRQSRLEGWLRQPDVSAWLAGAISSGRVRSRSGSGLEAILDCTRVFVFPSPNAHGGIVAGGELPAKAQGIFRLVAMGGSVPAEPGDADRLQHTRPTDEDQQFKQLELVHRLVEQVAGATDPAEIARVSARLIAEMPEAQGVMILLADQEKEALVVAGAAGTIGLSAGEGERFSMREGIPGKVFSQGESHLANDVAAEALSAPTPGRTAGSELCVPLKAQNQTTGLIDIRRAAKNAFSEGDRSLAEVLAGVIAPVMANARSYQEERVTLCQLQAVWETSLDINADLEEKALFNRIVHRAKEQAQASCAALGLVRDGAQIVDLVVSETPWYAEINYVVPFMEGVVGRVAALGETLAVGDYYTWEGRLPISAPPPFTAIVGVPLIIKGKVIGAITVMDDNPGHVFQPDEIRLLELLAPQMAVAINNSRLYQELENRIQAQQEAERHMLQAARLAAVGEMAAGLAHEINNPLTTVAGFVELALDELPADIPQRGELAIVLKEAQRAQAVVQRLLDFSRQNENARAPTDINQLAAECVALMKRQANAAGAMFEIHLGEDLPLILANPDQIKQVLVNLVQNALQAMRTGGQITITTCLEQQDGKNGVSISIADTGEGIPEENLYQVFEPFFTTRPVGTGTGLGLSVSYGIVHDHGGDIAVDSQVGVGSRFTVWLPV